jgi:hypothetical protein
MFGVTVKAALELVRDAIAEDDALRAWAVAQYGVDADITVQVGFDEKDPPRAKTGPVVFMIPAPYTTAAKENLDDALVVIGVGFTLTDPRKVETEADASAAATVTYSGLMACIDFGDLVFAAVISRHTDVFEVSEASIGIDENPAWPVIQGAIRLELRPLGTAPGGPG